MFALWWHAHMRRRQQNRRAAHWVACSSLSADPMFAVVAAAWQPPRCGVARARPDVLLRTAPVLALLDGQKPILPTEFTQAVPDRGQARLPLSPTLPDPRAKIPGARELPQCTVVVAGANGRVGSRVVTELLRKHSKVNVRALVRSAKP